MKKRLLAAILSVAMVATLVSGCGANTGSGSTSETGTTTGSTDTTITANLGSEPADLCSATTTDTVSGTVLRHVVDPLVGLDADDNPTEGLGTAESWEISEDGLTYTFKLREDQKWSNGEPVTANDFVFAWQLLEDPATASEYSYIAYFIKNAEAVNNGEMDKSELGVKALDDYTLEVTLEQPTAYALGVFAFYVMYPINEKGYTEAIADGSTYGTDVDKLVTNGAYSMTSWEHKSQIVLAKNDDYHRADEVDVTEITFLMLEDSNAILSSFESGELDSCGLTAEQAKMLAEQGTETYTYDDGSTWYLEFNTQTEALANQNLRTAIAYAIDSQSFVDNILQNDSKICTGFVPNAITGLSDSFSSEVGTSFTGYDLDKAKEYYEKALAELGTDKVELTMICDSGDVAEKNAAFIQEQLATLGVDLEIKAMEFKSRLEAMTNKDFDIVFAGWGPDYNDPMTFLDLWVTGGGNNHTSYSSEEYDSLIEAAQTELDPETRMNYLYEAEKLVMTDLPIAPIYQRSRNYAVSDRLDASTVVRTAFQDMDLRFAKLK